MAEMINEPTYDDVLFRKANFALIGIQILNGCKEHIRKRLSEEWYLFNDWYEVFEGKLHVKENHEFVRNLYGGNISISAIVGKNGSGKSSVMELVYRIANNLSVCMTQGSSFAAAEKLQYIDGVCAVLYYESRGCLGSVTINNLEVIFKWGATIEYKFYADKLHRTLNDADKKILNEISRLFCFCLVSNYAMMSLYSQDLSRDKSFGIDRISSGHWLDSIYNKNDGYTASLGIEPYKGNGNIDLNKQRKLCLARLSGMLVDTHLHGEEYFDGYSYERIDLKFDKDYLFRKVNGTGPSEGMERRPSNEFNNLFKKPTILAAIVKQYGFEKYNKKDAVVRSALAYLAVKTLQIAEVYPKFEQYQQIGGMLNYAKTTEVFDRTINESNKHAWNVFFSSEVLISQLVADLLNDNTHITLKLRQMYHFMEAVQCNYDDFGYSWECPDFKNYDEYMVIFNREEFRYRGIYSDIDHIMEYYPPVIFSPQIYLAKAKIDNRNKKQTQKEIMPYGSLSSGEQQFLQTTSSIIYHIRNINSVTDTGKCAKYHNVNLFLDEIETCFHPEYQQKFVKLLLSMFRSQKILDKCNINIIVATHSPFILSDIPKSNILYLERGQISKDTDMMVNPFCANVSDLLKQSFFLKNGFMGAWARDLINDLIKYLKDNDPRMEWTADKAKNVINLIGEPMLKGSLMNLYNKSFQQSKQDLLDWHRKEIERLSKT